ncbi:MAG: nuclear transport factor 2 family protein [Saprospiraceae bacterium]|nr:nuclear transport factor 2 family protein [Saprospiraceae bacterium]
MLFFCSFLPAFAQDEALKLKGLLEALRSAMQDPDEKKLNDLISAQLTYGHSNGVLDTKESFISNMVSGKSNFDDLEFSEISIVLNPHTAILRHILKAKSLDEGKEPALVNLKVMLVWSREGDKWKLIARQAVKVI